MNYVLGFFGSMIVAMVLSSLHDIGRCARALEEIASIMKRGDR